MRALGGVLGAAIGWMLFRQAAADRWRDFHQSWFGRLILILGFGAAVAGMAWWWFGPIMAARDAMDALQSGDRSGFEAVANPDTLIGVFYDEWAGIESHRDSVGHPRAMLLAVRPEAIAHLHGLYVDAMSAAAGLRPWLLDSAVVQVGPAMRVAARQRTIALSVSRGVVHGTGWLVLRMTPTGWRLVAIRGIVPLVDALLQTTGATREVPTLLPPRAPRAPQRTRRPR